MVIVVGIILCIEVEENRGIRQRLKAAEQEAKKYKFMNATLEYRLRLAEQQLKACEDDFVDSSSFDDCSIDIASSFDE